MSNTQKNKYQDSLNLPSTSFPMRAGLPKREPERLKQWYDNDLYGQIRTLRANAPKYILHDGPPYANGRIHTGTAMNKILKDIVVKYKTMCGCDAPFVPGWDCHGLPVEHAMFKELNATKEDVDQVEFRQKARQYAARFIDIQRTQFKRLGVLGEWDNPYVTMDHAYEADILRAFGELYEKGYIYKGLKPIHWSIACETALAEAEVEYHDHTSPSIYVKFPVAPGQSLPLEAGDDPSVVIWTTTPWTLPANRAVCLKPDISYTVVELDGETVILAVDLLEEFFTKLGRPVPDATIVCKGSDLAGIMLQHPIDPDRTVPVILGEHVVIDTGTGCVHTAPGHGQEDYIVGLKYDLEIASPVNEKGCFTAEVPLYEGMNVFDANPVIIKNLEEKGILVLREDITHSYPHCWRSHTPVIFRATEQWFVGVERHDMRGKALNAVDDVQWVPSVGKQRIGSMLEQRPDWCLSRQRLWGAPIPVFYCRDCGMEKLDAAIVDHVGHLVEQESSDVWFARDAVDLLPEGTTCDSCSSTHFRKETDILDVWFDSGVSHRAVLERRKQLSSPADLYLEGSDQHRGWFQVSLLTGIGLNDSAPYKTVLTHGWTLTESGEKESKSKGNFTDPEWVCNEMGADILRLWVGTVNYMQDVQISPNLLRQVGDSYRRIRNTFKFLLGNISDFDPATDTVSMEELLALDRYMLHRLEEVRSQVAEAYERFELYRVFHLVHHFCTVDLSARYCDILKDRLYAEQAKGLKRRSAQTVLRRIAVVLVKLLAPVLSFTADEIWDYLTEYASSAEEGTAAQSVHLSNMPEAEPGNLDEALASEFEILWAVRDEVLRELEKKRQEGSIGSSLEGTIELFSTDKTTENVLKTYENDLASLCIVSRAEIAESTGDEWVTGQEYGKIQLRVAVATAEKCARCWNYFETVGTISDCPDICRRCYEVLNADE
jgi:isoleucyl-tRNA synthetase